jgi:S1-C subfamily serine protease
MILSKQQILGLLALLGVGTGVGMGAAYWSRPNAPEGSSLPLTPAVQEVVNNQSSPPVNLSFVSAVVDRVGSAVVKIDSLTPATEARGDDEETEQERGTGSGFILSADGQIVTNAHVVDKATQVTVTLKDGRTLPGKVMGRDPVTDLAVVKVQSSGLPTVQIGDSSNLAAGEWAIAIGNPLGLDNSVTLGIISATGRSSSEVGIPDKRVRYIQADVAINPGNSGGPLLNARGEVIGINTAIRADAQGLGFAIPMQTAQRIIKQIVATGQASHPYLGVKMVESDSELQAKLGNDEALRAAFQVGKGVIVVEVLPNTPAARAGLQRGDVLLKIGNQAVNSPTDVQEQVESSEIGKMLALEVSRAGQRRNLQIQPELYPNSPAEP